MGDEAFVAIDYRLPVTVVRLTGTITTTTDKLKPPESERAVVVEASATLDVRADDRATCTLVVPERSMAQLELTLKLLPDGRMASSAGELDDQSASALAAALTVGVSTTSSLLPLLGGAGVPGVIGAVAAGALTGAAAGLRIFGALPLTDVDLAAILEGAQGQQAAADPGQPRRPTLAEVGIDARFAVAQPATAQVLHAYRVALLYLASAHASAAEHAHADPLNGADRLRALDRALRSSREEAARTEEIYRAWRLSQVTSEVQKVDEQLYVDDLPTDDQLHDALTAPPAGDDVPRWWRVASRLRLAVTCQPTGELPDTGTRRSPYTDEQHDDGTVVHRRPRAAKVTTWRLSRADGGTWRRDIERVDWMLVTLPVDRGVIRLPLGSDDDAKLTVDFDASGAITSVTASATGGGAAAAQTLSTLPGTVATAMKSGADIAAQLGPAARAAGLKARIEEEEMRAKLDGLLNPAPDSLAKLRKELKQAEIEARLAVARRLVSDPSGAIVVTTPVVG